MVYFLWRCGTVVGIFFFQIEAVKAQFDDDDDWGDDDAFGDDAGGTTDTDFSQYQDPASEAMPSYSSLGQFGEAAVSVDSIPCAQIGKDVLLRNGTAVDAAIAVLFCNGVVNPHSMGIGGGFFMTIFLPNGSSYALVAREMAPEKSFLEMFKNNTEGNMSMAEGPLSVAVPGEIKGYWEAKQRLGNPEVSWASLVEPTIKMCEDGIIVPSDLGDRVLPRRADRISENPHFKQVFYNEEKKRLHRTGELYKRPVFARTLRKIAEHGADGFYSGEVAEDLVDDIQKAGGIITKRDLERYHVIWEDPIKIKLPNSGGLSVISSPPPASGAITASILGIVANYKPEPLDRRRPLSWHRFAEAAKYAYARRTYLGDWNNATIQKEVEELIRNLTSRHWLNETRNQISDETTFEPKHYGVKNGGQEDSGTAHMSILGPAGDAVSVTSTINLWLGGFVMSPKTGIILNNEMDDFSYPYKEGNTFGFPPSANNYLHPRKRPVSSMSPTIVHDSENRVVAVVGASGGNKIISAVAQVMYRIIYLGQNVKEAIDSRRCYHTLFPNRFDCEIGVTKWLKRGLEKFNHHTEKFPIGGAMVQAIHVNRNTGEVTANADYRKNGTVEGF